MIHVKTQAELDAALRDHPDDEIVCIGTGEFEVSGHATVRAADQASVSASGQATVRAWDQATVRAWGQASVSASGQATVRASEYVPVRLHGGATCEGGNVLPAITTAEQWCDFYGAEVVEGCAILFKAVDASYRSPRGGLYVPGTTPEAPDWDGGKSGLSAPVRKTVHEIALALENGEVERRLLAGKLLAISKEDDGGVVDRTHCAA